MQSADGRVHLSRSSGSFPPAVTVPDGSTGLQWEQKTDDASVQDQDDTYPWTDLADADATDSDGTAFPDFLGTPNGCTSTEQANRSRTKTCE